MQSPLLLVAVLIASAPAAGAVENSGFENCDFEQGIEGWGVWYSDNPNEAMTRYPYSADTAVAHGGKQSLKIVAPDENGRAFVNRSSGAIKPGARYAISYWFRKTPELDDKKFRVRLNCRSATPPTGPSRLKSLDPLITSRKTEGPWHYRAGYLRIPKDVRPFGQLGLYLREARGTIWIDDIQIREIPPDENAVADLWVYDPYRVELGGAPLRKFQELQKANDPILGRAMQYNEALVRSAFVKENMRRLQRAAHYDKHVDVQAVGRLATAMQQAEQDLAALYGAYGEAYLDRKNAEKAARFDQLADALQPKLDTLDGQIKSQIGAATKRLEKQGTHWNPPPEPLDVGLPTISPDGRVNQIIFAKRSIWCFQEMEKPLGLDPVHSVSPGTPISTGPGNYDWSSCDRQWDAVRAAGIAKKSCLATSLNVHDGSPAVPWFLKKAQADPEILHVTRPPVELNDRGYCRQLNWWHPEVKQYIRDMVGHMGRTFRDRSEFLFYVFQAECVGPYVSTAEGTRSVGYGRRAEADFRHWLEKKYETIARLNTRWHASYPSFKAIRPPVDKLVKERRHTGPLAAEWETWREESYHQWRRLIYRIWKETDPTKPVVSSHSQIYLKFNDPEAFDNCDMLGWHYRGAEFMPVTLYLNSISRYNGFKPLAQYENFWGVQEDYDRMAEELPRRHGTQKYIFRLTVWNRFLQVWWYAYTPAHYLTTYDGNWLDPSYALTTLRYRSAALPVFFKKFKRLQQTLLESQIVPSRICVLAPSASMRNNFPYNATQTETRELFWQLFPRNYLYELVPEEYFLDGRAGLDDFDVLILPYALYLPEALQEKISRWLKTNPRLLVSCGPLALYDELGLDSRKLPDEIFGPGKLRFELADGKRPQWRLTAPAGETPVAARTADSEAIVLPRMFSELARKPGFVDDFLGRIEKATDRAAYDDGNAFEMVLRSRGDTRYLCVINPGLDDPAESTVHVKGVFRSVTDLDFERGFPVAAKCSADSTTFPLRLEPGEATIIRLEP